MGDNGLKKVHIATDLGLTSLDLQRQFQVPVRGLREGEERGDGGKRKDGGGRQRGRKAAEKMTTFGSH